ncbi:MAG: hypothetical protein CL840_06465 [Crocinitomicaceae bacterium]|nr:hypothetical protein [Crocinitomicaceae bacterium]|tara:strand:- start:11389 stop:12213 length:825 start_codon:yes stop_codon:yes gene_type:complete
MNKELLIGVCISIFIILGSCKTDELSNDEKIAQGKSFMLNEDYEKAIVEFNKILAASPGHCDAMLGIAISKNSIQDHYGVLELNKTNIKRGCLRARYFFEVGLAFDNLNSKDSAVFYYNKTIELDSNYAAAVSNMANIYMGKGEFEKSIIGFKRALEIDSAVFEPYSNLGLIYLELNQYELALEQFDLSLKYCFSCEIPFYNRGLVYYNMGQREDALKDFKRSTEINANNDFVWLNMGLLNEELNNLEEACANLKIARDLGNQEGLFYYNKFCL